MSFGACVCGSQAFDFRPSNDIHSLVYTPIPVVLTLSCGLVSMPMVSMVCCLCCVCKGGGGGGPGGVGIYKPLSPL